MGKVLLFQGDSITDCGRISCGGAGYPKDLWGPGYAGLIASHLLGEQPEKGWQIINRGISGNRIVDLYARWKNDCINLKPDLVSILIGVNDTLHERSAQNGVEVSRYEKFYRMLLDWTLEVLPQTKFILMEPYLPPNSLEQEWMTEVAERAEVVRKLAEEYKMPFVPLRNVFEDALKKAPPEYWFVDGVHPQPAGHQLIKNAWLKAAASVL